MDLILQPGTSYLNTTIVDSDGLPLYKIETSAGITLQRTTTIHKFLEDSDEMKQLAKITWHFARSSKLLYRGNEVEFDAFMPADETNVLGLQ